MPTGAAPEPSSYFVRVDEHAFEPTVHVGGAWSADEQHFSPLGGLIVHEIERSRTGRPPMIAGRICFDILGRIAFDRFEIHVETIRPGRTIELVQANVVIGGRAVVTARVWYLTVQDTGTVAGNSFRSTAAPGTLQPWPLTSVWPGGYIASLETRPVGTPTPGRTTAWVRSPIDLVADEQAGATASFVALVDTANGIAVRQPPTEWMFPNLDLTIHLFREPTGRWTGLDTSVAFGATGQGLTSTVLHDVDGPVGRAEQILTVRPQPPVA
ncbi:thioesterase family protein [Nocardia sp. NPDC052254]|uniref:thioesterase family protein n=1 Tax=Nocardia sp. NPDC052254 TaxID=3155681 RepID=UPI003421445A